MMDRQDATWKRSSPAKQLCNNWWVVKLSAHRWPPDRVTAGLGLRRVNALHAGSICKDPRELLVDMMFIDGSAD